MANRNKQRGNEFEREVVNKAKDKGIHAERAYASNGRALGEHEEVDCVLGKGPDRIRVQAKRRKVLPAYLQVPEEADIVAFKQDRTAPLVLLPLDDYLDLLKKAGINRKPRVVRDR